ncbi:MAG: FemAB family XrtA/PEP-CTERM system-associated protein [Candidatus Zipacnadales bacterium]
MSITAGCFDSSPPDWGIYLTTHPAATFFHQPGWLEVIREVYGGQAYYVTTRDGDKLTGILPLMQRKIIGAGNVLVSLPFADHAGICATTAEAEHALLAAAEELGRELNVTYVELRHVGQPCMAPFPCDTTRVLLYMPLPATTDDLWHSFSSNMRKKIRRSERDGLVSETVNHLGVSAFYDVYATNMRDLGSPMHSLRFFEVLYDRFPEQTIIILIRSDGEVAAAAIAVWFRDTLTVLCAHARRAFHRFFPNNLLYWRLFQVAIERGCKVADFGRSPRGSGIYEFKKGWGMEEQPLYYTLIPIRSQPRLGERRQGTLYTVFSHLWQRTPLPIARLIGPWLFSRLGV